MPLLFALMAYSIFGWMYVLAESVASYHRSTCQWETDYPKESSLGFYSYPEVCALQHQHAAPFFGYASIVLFMDFPLSNKSLCLLQDQLRVEL